MAPAVQPTVVSEDDRAPIAIRDDSAPPTADDHDESGPPIVPGTPSTENVLFVLLGMAGALAVVFRLVQLLG